jgi:general secretion pathway protein K
VLHYGVQDEEARLNLLTAPAPLLAALPGSGTELAQAIVAARQPGVWTAPEEILRRGLIAPAAFYGTAEQPGLASYVTVWGSGKVNVNTAPPPVLAALPGMTAAMVQAIVRYRQGEDQQPGTADDRHFREVGELHTLPEMDRQAVEQFETWLTVVPQAFRVMVTGRVAGSQGPDRLHRRLVIIDRTSSPASVRYWQRGE